MSAGEAQEKFHWYTDWEDGVELEGLAGLSHHLHAS